tara:strand:+ start:2275 stop:2451 length:177 start_codon:yes stop_codon:yes gene_type:complete
LGRCISNKEIVLVPNDNEIEGFLITNLIKIPEFQQKWILSILIKLRKVKIIVYSYINQ